MTKEEQTSLEKLHDKFDAALVEIKAIARIVKVVSGALLLAALSYFKLSPETVAAILKGISQ